MALPAVIEPCLPSPGEQPPTGPGWVHEIKHDGYRLMARRDALWVGIRLGIHPTGSSSRTRLHRR
jgi:ATP-dependent DNA ligase